MIVENLTSGPIRVPLGRGKVLHLGRGQSASVHKPATERPAFLKMVERKEIAVRSEQDAPRESGGNEDGKQPARIQRKGLR